MSRSSREVDLAKPSAVEAPESSLRLTSTVDGEWATLSVHGDVDASTAPQLAAVIDTLGEDVRVIELDLAELTFLDSTGLSVMAMALRRLELVDGSLDLQNAPPFVLELLRITDLIRFVRVVSERA